MRGSVISVFDRKEKVSINLKQGEKKLVKLCYNQFTSSIEPIKKIAIVDSLEINEKYQINYSTQGCFHSAKDSIEIKRGENAFFIKTENSSIHAVCAPQTTLFQLFPIIKSNYTSARTKLQNTCRTNLKKNNDESFKLPET